MEPTDEPWEIAADLTRKQYKSLAALRNLGGEAQTAEITSSTTGIYGQLLHEHYGKMREAGLVEKVGEGEPDPGLGVSRDGHKYRITDRGHEVLSAAQEDYDIDPLAEGTVRRRFDRLEGRIGSVEQQVKGQSQGGDVDGDLEAQVAELEERVDTIEETQEGLIDDVRKMADFLEETRKEVGLGGFWNNDNE